MCEAHYYRIRRNGTLDPKPMRTDLSYRGAHTRIAKSLGAARNHACVDCGGNARHWSYNHADPGEMINHKGYRYSIDPQFYEPRCPTCHVRHDRQS